MKFKNELERRIFEIAQRVSDDEVSVEHNKVLSIEIATSLEVASFVGAPKKEIDVITAGFRTCPDLKVLISCKDYRDSAEPADVQEWSAVIKTMNKYSGASKYLGLVVCPSGFTSGCEPWASSYNLGVIPPLKGKKLRFTEATCDQMFERFLVALGKRLQFPHQEIFEAPQFYEFVYQLTEAFEGRDVSAKQYGERYRLMGTGWVSSFPELVRMFMGKGIQEIDVTAAGINIRFSDNLTFRMVGKLIWFGTNDGGLGGQPVPITCEKNFSGQPCSMEFLKSLVLGQKMTSAGDWGDRFEFGLTDDLILAIEPARLQVYRTRNPVDQNLL